MRQFLPDSDTITELFGDYEAQGWRFVIQPAPRLGGYELRMYLGEASTAVPVFALPAAEMKSPEAAQRWLEYLRDHEVSKLAGLLRG